MNMILLWDHHEGCIYILCIYIYVCVGLSPALRQHTVTADQWLALWPCQTKHQVHPSHAKIKSTCKTPCNDCKHCKPWQWGNQTSLWYTRLGLCSILLHSPLVGAWMFMDHVYMCSTWNLVSSIYLVEATRRKNTIKLLDSSGLVYACLYHI